MKDADTRGCCPCSKNTGVTASATKAPTNAILEKHQLEHEGGETTKRSRRCPIPGSIQGHVEWGFGQPGIVRDDPVHDRGVGLDVHEESLPT